MKITKTLVAILTLWFGGLSVAVAQTTQGEIVGIARDQQGAALPAVAVTVTNDATGFSRSVVSGGSGEFRIPALPTGTYTLSAEKGGFATLKVAKVEILVGETRTVNLPMQIATHTENVTVESAAVQVDTETQHLGSVIEQTQVTALPLNGRNFAQLALLNAGVSASGGGGGQQGGEGGVSGYSSNGQRSSSNNFLVDGIDNNNYNAGSVSQLPSIDSIQEFQVQTNNYSAEYGRNSGSVINLVTKSGTNNLHGSLYEFIRNDALDARNYFANPNAAAPELRLNQFGGTLGGPVQKDKTFFFINYEGFRQRAGITRLTVVPTNAQKQGFFTNAAGQTVQIPVNPVSAQLFQLYPEPNTNQPGGNFISSPVLSNDTDQFLLKGDRRIGSDTLTARYSYTRQDEFSPFAGGQQTTSIPGFGVTSSGNIHLASIGYTKIRHPSMSFA
jgi:hypothetical protein